MGRKKILSLLLFTALIVNLLSFQIVFAEEANEYSPLYSDETEFLKKLQILDEAFDPTKQVTKAELAKMVIKVMHPEVDFSAEGEYATFIFNDVSKDHEYYSYIKACKDMRIVSGDSEGNFKPDSVVTLTDVITVLTNALGYTVYANELGGYPTGYYQVAYNTDLLDGVKASLSETVNADTVAKVIYNSLFADITGIASISKDGISIKIEEGKNLLSERLDIHEFDAIVYDNGVSAIKGDSMGDTERVVIQERSTGYLYSAYVNDTDIASYLGYRVKVFIRNNQAVGRNEVVHVSLHKRTQSISINSDMLINANADYLEYEENKADGKIKKIKFGELRPILLFNGLRITDKGLEEVIPNDGILTFIDNDGDNIFDIVDVLSFNYSSEGNIYNAPARNIIVDSVTTINGEKRISCMLNPANSLDLEDEELGYAFTAISDKKSIYDIGTYDVISISETIRPVDGKKFYFLTVNSDLVIGVLNSTGPENEIDVNGISYEVSGGLTSIKTRYFSTLALGAQIYLCLDATGKVAYSVSEEVNSKNYGYLIAMREKSDGDDYLVVKLFTKDGEIKTLPVSSKVTIDGVSCPTVSTQMTALAKRDSSSSKESFDSSYARPVIYKENSNGEIIKIDTDNPNISNITKKSDIYATHTTIEYDVDEVNDSNALKAGFRGLRTTDYTRSQSVEGKFYITSETVILGVPDIDTYGMKHVINFVPGKTRPLSNVKGKDQVVNEKAVQLHSLEITDTNYKVFKVSELNTDYAYDIQGYDIDVDTGIAGLVVLRGRIDVFNAAEDDSDQAPMYVFLRSTEVYDPIKEKNVKKVYYTKDGKTELSATIDTEECYYPYKCLIEGCSADYTMYNIAIQPLRAGDIIRVTEKNGEITHIDRVIAVAKDVKSYYSLMYYPTNSSYPYTNSKATVGVSSPVSEDYGVPFDTRDYLYTTGSSQGLFFAPVKSVSGNTLLIMTAYAGTAPSSTAPDNGEISTIDINDPSTYILQYMNTGDVITTIDINDDGKSANVKSGSVSDITTVEEAGSIENASMILIKHEYNNAKEIFIINNINKIPDSEKWWVEE